MSKKTSFLLTALVFFASTQMTFAAVTVTSEEDKTFNKNTTPTALRLMVIVDDVTTPVITTESGVRITIPDTQAMIFSTELTITELHVSGTAVSNGKVALEPAIQFEDEDKTLFIPVTANFAAGETLAVNGMYVEGFHVSSDQSDHMMVDVSGTEYLDSRTVYIQTSALEDTGRPETPTDFEVRDNPDGAGVLITWTNPTDLDLDSVNILRGKNNTPVNAVPYEMVHEGAEQFIDTDVEIGDTVKYILQATDGLNESENTEEIVFVVGSTPVVVPEPTPDTPDEEADPEDVVEETPAEEPAVPSEEPPALFSDVYGHWAESIILGMASRNVIYGNPDGTFNPNGHLNRAEAAALIYRILSPGGDPAAPEEKPFSDVEVDTWFAGYVRELAALELVRGYEEKNVKTYQPGKNVTRAEFLKMAMNLYYYMGNAELKGQIDALRDGETTSEYEDISSDDWYAPDVTAATKLGFVAGSKCEENTCFNPTSDITRAEATKILYEMFFAVSS